MTARRGVLVLMAAMVGAIVMNAEWLGWLVVVAVWSLLVFLWRKDGRL